MINIVAPLSLALCYITHAAGYVVADPENHPTLLKEIFPDPEGPAIVARPVDDEKPWMTREVAEEFDVVADPRFDPRLHSNSRLFGFKIHKRAVNPHNDIGTGAKHERDDNNSGSQSSDALIPRQDFSSENSASDIERKKEFLEHEQAEHGSQAMPKDGFEKRASTKYEEVSGTDDSDRPIVLPDGTLMKPKTDTKYYEWSMTEDTGESEEEEMAMAKHLHEYFQVSPPCGKKHKEDALPCRILQANPHPGTPQPFKFPGAPQPQQGVPAPGVPGPGVPAAVAPGSAPPVIPAPGERPHTPSPIQDDPWVPQETKPSTPATPQPQPAPAPAQEPQDSQEEAQGQEPTPISIRAAKDNPRRLLPGVVHPNPLEPRPSPASDSTFEPTSTSASTTATSTPTATPSPADGDATDMRSRCAAAAKTGLLVPGCFPLEPVELPISASPEESNEEDSQQQRGAGFGTKPFRIHGAPEASADGSWANGLTTLVTRTTKAATATETGRA